MAPCSFNEGLDKSVRQSLVGRQPIMLRLEGSKEHAQTLVSILKTASEESRNDTPRSSKQLGHVAAYHRFGVRPNEAHGA